MSYPSTDELREDVSNKSGHAPVLAAMLTSAFAFGSCARSSRLARSTAVAASLLPLKAAATRPPDARLTLPNVAASRTPRDMASCTSAREGQQELPMQQAAELPCNHAMAHVCKMHHNSKPASKHGPNL